MQLRYIKYNLGYESIATQDYNNFIIKINAFFLVFNLTNQTVL